MPILKVLGIDPGSIVTGYGVVHKAEGGRLIHVCNGVLRLDAAGPLSERLYGIYKGLSGIMEEHRPDAVAVESVFFSKNAKSAILLGEARGAALLTAAACGIAVFEYAPRAVKLAVSGYGNATKEQVGKMVGLLLKTPEPEMSDASDALAIAVCHINHRRSGVDSMTGVPDKKIMPLKLSRSS